MFEKFWEYAENVIRCTMEDPRERDEKRRAYLYAEKERAERRKELFRMPMRPYGFWTMEKHGQHRVYQKSMSNMRGRGDPYSTISDDPFKGVDIPVPNPK